MGVQTHALPLIENQTDACIPESNEKRRYTNNAHRRHCDPAIRPARSDHQQQMHVSIVPLARRSVCRARRPVYNPNRSAAPNSQPYLHQSPDVFQCPKKTLLSGPDATDRADITTNVTHVFPLAALYTYFFAFFMTHQTKENQQRDETTTGLHTTRHMRSRQVVAVQAVTVEGTLMSNGVHHSCHTHTCGVATATPCRAMRRPNSQMSFSRLCFGRHHAYLTTSSIHPADNSAAKSTCYPLSLLPCEGTII